MILATFVVCGYVGVSIANDWDFTFFTFYALTIPLLSVIAVSMTAIWKKRHLLSINTKLLMIEWVSAVVWYWLIGIFYHFMTINVNSEQLRVIAFGYYWEVFIIAGITYSISQYIFMPITRYVASGHADDPARLYRRMLNFPLNVALRMSGFTIFGYIVGTMQVHFWADASNIETVKNVGIGLVLSLFVALYQYLVIDNFLGPVRTKLINQYGLDDALRRKYSRKVFGVVTLLTLASLSLMIMVFIQSFQSVTKNNLLEDTRNNIRSSIAEANNKGRSLDLRDLENNGKNKAWLINEDAELPIKYITPRSHSKLKYMERGYVRDLKHDLKLIIVEPYGNKRLIVVIYEAAYYSPLYKIISFLTACSLFIVLLSIVAITAFNRLLTNAINSLIEAVRQATRTGKYAPPSVDTGDEFQVLSLAFNHFVHQNRQYTLRIKEEHARLEAAINSLDVGLLMTFENTHVISYNVALLSILNLHESRIEDDDSRLGLTLDIVEKSLATIPDFDLTTQVHQCQESGQAFHIKDIVYGDKVIAIFGAPIMVQLDKIIGTVVLVEDVTEQKVLERSKDEFFSIASHELRTPLTSIKGNASMILDFYQEAMKDSELKEMVEDMHESSVRLIGIVNDFLDMSRLEQGKVKFEYQEVSLEEIIENVAYEMKPILNEKNIYLNTDVHTLNTLPKVWADINRLKQVVYNLVGNAAKFTDQGGITIKTAVENSASGQMVRVRVIDTGRGIALDSQKYLFRKLQQAGSSLITRDTTRGTGLGLYISKKMIENMGGTIALDSSEEGKGSSFSFTVPLVTEEMKAEAAASQTKTSSQTDSETGMTRVEESGVGEQSDAETTETRLESSDDTQAEQPMDPR